MTTTLETLDARIATRRAALTQQRAERLDALDLSLTMTQRQVNEYLAETARIDAAIVDLNTCVETLAALDTLDADTKWRDCLTSARATLCDERLTIKSPIRDTDAKARAQDLEWSIKLVDRGLGISTIGPIIDLSSTRIGQLMIAAGYDVAGPALRGPHGWGGSLPEVEERIKTQTRKRAAALAKLDEALMDNAERAQRDAESRAHREALDSMVIRMGADGHLVAFTADDEPLAIADMTPQQQRAFERLTAAERQREEDTYARQLGQR